MSVFLILSDGNMCIWLNGRYQPMMQDCLTESSAALRLLRHVSAAQTSNYRRRSTTGGRCGTVRIDCWLTTVNTWWLRGAAWCASINVLNNRHSRTTTTSFHLRSLSSPSCGKMAYFVALRRRNLYLVTANRCALNVASRSKRSAHNVGVYPPPPLLPGELYHNILFKLNMSQYLQHGLHLSWRHCTTCIWFGCFQAIRRDQT